MSALIYTDAAMGAHCYHGSHRACDFESCSCPCHQGGAVSALLAIVRDATDLKVEARAAWLDAMRRARTKHTLEEVGEAAGLTKAGVRYALDPDRKTTTKERSTR